MSKAMTSFFKGLCPSFPQEKQNSWATRKPSEDQLQIRSQNLHLPPWHWENSLLLSQLDIARHS